MPHTPLGNLAPAIPRAEYTTRWAPTAESRLAWHRHETALYARAAHLGISRTETTSILRTLIKAGHHEPWSLDDLFHLADTALTYASADPVDPVDPAVTADEPAPTATDGQPPLPSPWKWMRTPRPAAPPVGTRPLGTAWTRYVHAHPEQPNLRARHAQT